MQYHLRNSVIDIVDPQHMLAVADNAKNCTSVTI
jgi:hypothetical protein